MLWPSKCLSTCFFHHFIPCGLSRLLQPIWDLWVYTNGVTHFRGWEISSPFRQVNSTPSFGVARSIRPAIAVAVGAEMVVADQQASTVFEVGLHGVHKP